MDKSCMNCDHLCTDQTFLKGYWCKEGYEYYPIGSDEAFREWKQISFTEPYCYCCNNWKSKEEAEAEMREQLKEMISKAESFKKRKE